MLSCVKPIRVECAKPPKPKCAPIVDEYLTGINKQPPELKQPTPHELLDILQCVERLTI